MFANEILFKKQFWTLVQLWIFMYFYIAIWWINLNLGTTLVFILESVTGAQIHNKQTKQQQSKLNWENNYLAIFEKKIVYSCT